MSCSPDMKVFFFRADSEDPIVVEDFAFNKQKNFFTIPPDCKLPLGDFPQQNSAWHEPLDGSEEACVKLSSPSSPDVVGDFAFSGSVAPVSLSLIEEVTEYSSSSAIKSANSTPRPQNPGSEAQHKGQFQFASTNHIPKILNTMSPRESQEQEDVTSIRKANRSSTTKKSLPKESMKDSRGVHRESREMVRPLRQRLRPLDATLPSKSQPGTPRDEEEAKDEAKVRVLRICRLSTILLFQAPTERYAKAKPKVVGRRFLRPSPPRDPAPSPTSQKSFQSSRLQHRDPRPMADQPVQTKTGLTVTLPRRDSTSPPVSRSTSREMIPRSASSASLLLHHPPTSNIGPRRGLSRSSGNLAASHPVPSFDHVQSKVRQYIHEVKTLPKKELSRSCGNLSPTKNMLQVPSKDPELVQERPRTAEAPTRLHTVRQQSTLGNGVSKRSKSETNLRRPSLDNLHQPLQLSKSSISLAFGNLDHLFESSSGEDTARTSIFKPLFKPSGGGDEVEVCPEDLLALVFQEREGKQETKKVFLDIRVWVKG